jgi:uncharacterized protein YbjT (DUF2867 family)
VVVDVTNSPSWEDAAVLKFFETSTRNLLAYEASAGVGHHVALSVVGTERLLESGFFRATQFFEFVKGIADFSTDGNTVRLPPVLIQPMAADDVASAVGRFATGSPVNGTVEVGGPEQFRLDELVRQGLAARYYGIALSESPLLPGADASLGERRFETWLSQSAIRTPHPAVETVGANVEGSY